MAKCKYCHQDITRLDKDVCPFCGGSKPLEGTDTKTQDYTQVFNQIDDGDKVKFHSKLKAALFAFFLGVFGGHFFYLGFKKKGFITIVISLIFIGGLGSLIYFVANWNSPLAFLVFYFVIELIMIVVGIRYLTNSSSTDSSGVFLK